MPGKQESLLNRHMGICSHRVKILAKTEVYMCVYIYIYLKKNTKKGKCCILVYL